MKRLTLLRHGHAVAESSGIGDADRALSPTGVAEARRAGERLGARFGSCDLLLVSSALRARQTAEAALAGGLKAQAVRTDGRLYLASPTVLREVVGGCAAGVDHLVVVGHNPGLSELTARLSGDPAEQGLATADWRSFELESL